MLKWDTFDRIAKILERESELPGHLRSNLLLIALQYERDVRREDHLELLALVMQNSRALGRGGERDKESLTHRVHRLEGIVRIVIWILSPIVLSFLAGLGLFLFDSLFR